MPWLSKIAEETFGLPFFFFDLVLHNNVNRYMDAKPRGDDLIIYIESTICEKKIIE